MEHNSIFQAQLVGEHGRLTRVIDVGVLCGAPGFVANDPVTVNAGRVRAILIAEHQGLLVMCRHWLLLRPWKQAGWVEAVALGFMVLPADKPVLIFSEAL